MLLLLLLLFFLRLEYFLFPSLLVSHHLLPINHSFSILSCHPIVIITVLESSFLLSKRFPYAIESIESNRHTRQCQSARMPRPLLADVDLYLLVVDALLFNFMGIPKVPTLRKELALYTREWKNIWRSIWDFKNVMKTTYGTTQEQEA